MADMEILHINAGFLLRKKSSRRRTRLPDEVIALLTPAAQAKHIAESDEPMQVDADEPAAAAHPGINPPNVVAPDIDDGLDDLIFVIPNDDGGEQVIRVQNEPMDIDVAIGDIVVDVNEAGDYNIQEQA